MNYQLVLRSRTGQVGAVIVGAFGLFFVIMVWASDGPGSGIAAAAIALALCYFTWFLWAWPSVTVEQAGITVRNHIRTYLVGWDALKEAESSYGLFLVTTPSSYEEETGTTDPATSALQQDGGESGSERVSWPPKQDPSSQGNGQKSDHDKYPLTGGSVTPPKRIYCAGVPARGGFSASRQKDAPVIPELYFENGPRVTMRVEPAVAVRLIEEEKLLIDHPERRDPTHQATTRQIEGWESISALKRLLYGKTPPTSQDAGQVGDRSEPFRGVVARVNYLQLAGLVATIAAALILGFTF